MDRNELDAALRLAALEMDGEERENTAAYVERMLRFVSPLMGADAAEADGEKPRLGTEALREDEPEKRGDCAALTYMTGNVQGDFYTAELAVN